MTDRADRLLYVGIDEAGYGPLLGPLCVGLTALELPASALARTAHGAPDVWKLLRRAVARPPTAQRSAAAKKAPARRRSPVSADRTSRGRILVADSKELKLPNHCATTHPLRRLEPGVLCFLAHARPHADGSPEPAPGGCPSNWGELARALGCTIGETAAPDAVWSRLRERSPETWPRTPASHTADELRVRSASLGGALAQAGVAVAAMRCEALDETRFNASLGELGVKSAVSFGVVARLIRSVWLDDAATRRPADAPVPRLVIDRQGGRTRYAGVLAGAVDRPGGGAQVEAVAESASASVYDLAGAGSDAGRRLRVIVAVEAERAHFPVALASMTAKYVRELAMSAFNAHWSERLGEIKPTAGYTADARRWLDDARRTGLVRESELEALCRRA